MTSMRLLVTFLIVFSTCMNMHWHIGPREQLDKHFESSLLKSRENRFWCLKHVTNLHKNSAEVNWSISFTKEKQYWFSQFGLWGYNLFVKWTQLIHECHRQMISWSMRLRWISLVNIANRIIKGSREVPLFNDLNVIIRNASLLQIIQRYQNIAIPWITRSHKVWTWKPPIETQLTHWGRDKMAAIFQTTLLNEFSWMKMCKFRLRFHWTLFPMIQLTIFQHLFR